MIRAAERAGGTADAEAGAGTKKPKRVFADGTKGQEGLNKKKLQGKVERDLILRV